jgi:hypothetical protein
VLLAIGWAILKGSNPFSPTIPSFLLTRTVAENPDDDPR